MTPIRAQLGRSTGVISSDPALSRCVWDDMFELIDALPKPTGQRIDCSICRRPRAWPSARRPPMTNLSGELARLVRSSAA